MELEIEGFDEFFDLIDSAGGDVKKECRNMINRVCNKTKAKAVTNTPVGVYKDGRVGGTLQKNWHFRTKSEYEGIIYNNTEYALMWGM